MTFIDFIKTNLHYDSLKVLHPAPEALLFLLLTIASNFLAPIFNCSTQYILSKNIIVKHVICILVLFFIYELSYVVSANKTELTPPHYNFLATICVYVIFLLFTKIEDKYIISSVIILLLLYTIILYINYYKSLDYTEHKYKNTIDNLYVVCFFLIIVFLTIILYGFILFFIKQTKKHKYNWSTKKFFLGVNKCKN
tara:strand:+ start:12970 stop:13557 length:588 start_codon:yes stop_codon:yes gene_type:complete